MENNKPKVAILSLVDPRKEMYETALKWGFDYDGVNKKEVSKLLKKLEKKFEIIDSEIVDSKEDSINYTKKFINKNIELLIVFIPGWTFPVFCAMAARLAAFHSIPTLIVSSFALSGPTASKGALDEIGVEHRIIYGDLDKEKTIEEIVKYAKAVSVIHRLRGMTYGAIGGRSMGMVTAMIDPSYWLKSFGIDVEHVDQSEILRISNSVKNKEIEEIYEWTRKEFKNITCDNQMLTAEILKKQLKGYLAIKKIADDNKFDFMGVKCINELSDYFCSQCMAAGLMNDPYDHTGSKKPVVYACECDANGALSMEILHLLSDKKPVLFMDVISFNEEQKIITCMNCGGAATWYSMRAYNSSENLNKVEILPHVHGKAGGGCLAYVAKEAEHVTMIRLSRKDGKYRMFGFTGRLVENVKADINLPWPTAHVKLNNSPSKLLEQYASQHIHIVEGNYIKECEIIAEILGIEFINM